MVLEKALESPLGCKKIKLVNPEENQPSMFIGGTDAEGEAPVLGHWMWRADSLGKTLMLGKIEGERRWRQQRIRWFDGITDPIKMNLSKLWEMVMDREAWHAAFLGGAKSQTGHSDWTTITKWFVELNLFRVFLLSCDFDSVCSLPRLNFEILKNSVRISLCFSSV